MSDLPIKDEWRSPDGAVKLLLGDCLEILPTLEPGSVDAVVTDPPFGIGWSRGTWNDDPECYGELIRVVVDECNRLVATGWCFVFQAMPNAPRFSEWFGGQWRIFAACKNFAQIRPTGMWHSWDPVVCWHNGPNSGPNSGHVNRDYFVGNVAGVFGEKSEHPCPKPVDTLEHIAQIATRPSGIILDPFMGSGTTGVACIRTGRRFLGIEIDPTYFGIAVRRCQAELARTPLFPDQPDPQPAPAMFPEV